MEHHAHPTLKKTGLQKKSFASAGEVRKIKKTSFKAVDLGLFFDVM
jgi:hypothetical protein